MARKQAPELQYVLYKKECPKRKALTKAEIAMAQSLFEATARVRRPGLEAFLADGFAKLPALPVRTIDNRAKRILEHSADGFVIPMDSLGRQKAWTYETDDELAAVLAEQARSTTQSIMAWVRKNQSHIVDPDAISIVSELR